MPAPHFVINLAACSASQHLGNQSKVGASDSTSNSTFSLSRISGGPLCPILGKDVPCVDAIEKLQHSCIDCARMDSCISRGTTE